MKFKLLIILMVFMLSFTIYLPIISNSINNAGIESESKLCTKWYKDNSITRVSVRWADVEKVKGVYDWSSLDWKLCDKKPYLITVKTTPEWALKDGDRICKLPINYNDAYRFYKELIKRYKPVYLEIWNEPDALEQYVPEGNEKYYGCIGDGIEYANFVNGLINYIDTDTKIVIGAVSSATNRFTYDMLVNAKGYDAVSFHCYEYLYNDISNWCLKNINYLKTLTDKEIILSETAVIYKTGTIKEYEDNQVNYYLNLTKIDNKSFWYTLHYNNWPIPINTDMIYWNQDLKEIMPRKVWFEYYR